MMDTLSTAYDFAMHDSVADGGDTTGSASPRRSPREPRYSVETFLDGLDAVAAVYEPARA